jgi:kynureninase
MRLLEGTGLTSSRYGFAIGTPREPQRRGGHVAVEHDEAARIARALKARGIIPDFRAPNVIRLAPTPLSTTYHVLWLTVRAIEEIIEAGEHLRGAAGRDLVA